MMVDARTDIFSLGVMLYEMLAGRQPFTGETINHVIVAILEQEPVPLACMPFRELPPSSNEFSNWRWQKM